MTGPWLGFDTTGEILSVAVTDGTGRMLAEIQRRAPRLHASLLLPTVAEALRLGGVARGDVAAVVANRGPGSYTGIRIGLAAMQALSKGLSRPAYGVPGLWAAAFAGGPGALTAPILDARRGDVFCALYESRDEGRHGLPREILAPKLRPLEEFLEQIGQLGRTVRLVGDAVALHREILMRFAFAAHGPPELRALDLIRFAQAVLEGGEVPDALSGTALYLRP